jgi:hypothetical protein
LQAQARGVVRGPRHERPVGTEAAVGDKEVRLAASNPYLKRFFATRRRLKVGLVLASAVSGAIVGAATAVLGKIVAGASPATLMNYVINLCRFGLFGNVAFTTAPALGLDRPSAGGAAHPACCRASDTA